MTEKTIDAFANENFAKGPKKIISTNKTHVYYIDDIWSVDILDTKDYGPENIRGHRYILVVIDNFSKIGWTVPLNRKNAQTIKHSYENVLERAKTKPKLIETDRGKKFHNIFFQNFLKYQQ